MRALVLLILALSGCVRNQAQSPTWEEEDKSIRFPKFNDRSMSQIGKEGGLHEMDGETLRAINIAASDFIRPTSKARPCWETREAHRYRVVREGGIIFVQIYLDPFYCEMPFMFLDYGVKYAISTEGRILRRLYEGEPEDLSGPPAADAGELGPEYSVDPSRLGVIDAPVDCEFLRSLERSSGRKFPNLSDSCPEDGGTPPLPAQPDGGTPPIAPQMDGGAPPTQ
jgi:hypothetical protein